MDVAGIVAGVVIAFAVGMLCGMWLATDEGYRAIRSVFVRHEGRHRGGTSHRR